MYNKKRIILTNLGFDHLKTTLVLNDEVKSVKGKPLNIHSGIYAIKSFVWKNNELYITGENANKTVSHVSSKLNKRTISGKKDLVFIDLDSEELMEISGRNKYTHNGSLVILMKNNKVASAFAMRRYKHS